MMTIPARTYRTDSDLRNQNPHLHAELEAKIETLAEGLLSGASYYKRRMAEQGPHLATLNLANFLAEKNPAYDMAVALAVAIRMLAERESDGAHRRD